MGRPYSQDLRDRVMAAVDGGLPAGQVAKLFLVSVSYIYKVLGRRRATGETTARRLGGGPTPKLADHLDALRCRVAEAPDATLAELLAWLAADRGVTVSVGCLWTTLHRLGLPRKKRPNGRPNRTGRTSPTPARTGVPVRPS